MPADRQLHQGHGTVRVHRLGSGLFDEHMGINATKTETGDGRTARAHQTAGQATLPR